MSAVVVRILAIVSLVTLSLSAAADNGVSVFLMPCPDCGKTVSKRALMCPSCGCDGKVIRGAAKALTKKAKPKEPDRMVLADFGKTKCEALPVKMTDGAFVGADHRAARSDADGDLLKVRIEISDNDGLKYSVPAFSLTGDIGEGVAAGKDKHIVWDAGTDWDGEYSDLWYCHRRS